MEDTIAAIATPYGEGGIGIIRISGPDSIAVLHKIFKPKNIDKFVERKLTYGEILNPDTGELIDEVMAVYMNAPHTYTTEDVAEVDCHGGMISLREILMLIIKCGVRIAEKGEFTKRAFLNGRLDLSQAEAVIDIIKSKNVNNYRAAQDQLQGGLSQKIREMRKDFMDVMVSITVNLDYPEEDIEEVVYPQLKKSILSINNTIDKLVSTAGTGKILRDGLKVSIIGKPNVGKSSLMNVLLKESRAIVTEVPGTTRDTIEEFLNIRNIPIKLSDTAGIRDTDDIVEKIGIEKSRSTFLSSDLVILVLDGSCELSEEDINIMKQVAEKKVIVLINKMDLGIKLDKKSIKTYLKDPVILEISVVDEKGIDKLEDNIEDFVYNGKVTYGESVLITNARHEESLINAQQCLKEAVDSISDQQPLEFIEVDLRSGYEYLGEIIGETVSDDIIDEVFSRFCLGK